MKILVFECWNNSPQFETGLEIAEVHTEKGDDVQYVNIGQHLSFLEWQTGLTTSSIRMALHRKEVAKKMKKAKQLLHSNTKFSTDTLLSKQEINQLRTTYSFENATIAKEYHWEGIDIGMAAISSLISVTNDLDPDVSKKYQKPLDNIIHSSKIVAKSFSKWLEKERPDLVYFRNGRVSSYKPIYRICQQQKQKFLIHDRGCNKNHYKLSPDLRHNFEMVNDEILAKWENEKNVPHKIEIGNNFFTQKRDGKGPRKSFITNQEKNTLPSNWDSTKYNIVYFNSSISEFAAVQQDQFKDNIFENQINAIPFIAETIANDPSIDFHLRLHPNLVNQAKEEQDLWQSMQEIDGVNLIPAADKVDTYSLIENADLIIVYLSTVGIEAAYMEKPVIQLSKSAYHKLGSTYLPKTKTEFQTLLLNKELLPKSKEGAVKYGFYFSTFGTKYKYFQPSETMKNQGTFKGVNLQDSSSILKLAKQLKQKLN